MLRRDIPATYWPLVLTVLGVTDVNVALDLLVMELLAIAKVCLRLFHTMEIISY